MSKFCMNCGNELGPDAKFCRVCGAPAPDHAQAPQTPPAQEPLPYVRPESPPAPKTSAEKVCPSCGQPVSPGMRFCRKCGAPLPPPKPVPPPPRPKRKKVPRPAPAVPVTSANVPEGEYVLNPGRPVGVGALLLGITLLVLLGILGPIALLDQTGSAGMPPTAAPGLPPQQTGGMPEAPGPMDLPEEIAAMVDPMGDPAAYDGYYNGTITFEGEGLEVFNELGAPQEYIDALYEMSGQSYDMTAIFDAGSLDVFSETCPMGDDDDGEVFYINLSSEDYTGGIGEEKREDWEDEDDPNSPCMIEMNRICLLQDGSLYLQGTGMMQRQGQTVMHFTYRARMSR